MLNLCEVLLRDRDACQTELECNAIDQAMSTLNSRWQHICQQAFERKPQ